MAFDICPCCHRTLPNPGAAGEKQDILCPSCGAALCRIPSLHFPYGKRLPSTPQKKNRVACPYCNTHYSLNYTPHQGLVGCQSCLKIFAIPPEEFSNAGGGMTVPINLTNTEEIPIRQGVIPSFSGNTSEEPSVAGAIPPPPPGVEGNFFSPPPLAPREETGNTLQAAPSFPGGVSLRDPAAPSPLSNLAMAGKNSPEIKKIVPEGQRVQEDRGENLRGGLPPEEPSPGTGALLLQLLGNLLWLLLGGLSTAIGCFITGAILCLTIIGIPFGLQVFKFGKLELSPFGGEAVKKVDQNGKRSFSVLSVLMNILWILLGGWLYCLLHLLYGVLLCLIIIGIPFGLQHFKFALLMLSPFGKEVRRKPGALPTGVAVVLAIAVMMIYSFGGCIYNGFTLGKDIQRAFPENSRVSAPGSMSNGQESDNAITID